MTVIFCGVRIVGNAIQIYIYTASNPSSGLQTTAGILSSIGLSPLMLATVGFLNRIDIICSQRFVTKRFVSIALAVLVLPITLSLILGIVGGTGSSSGGVPKGSGTYEASVIIYLASWFGLVILAIMIAARRHSGWLPKQEVFLLACCFIALPLLLVRIAYSIGSAFSHSHLFTFTPGDDGAVTVRLVMETIEEWVIVIFYVIAGLFVRRVVLSGPGATRKSDQQNWDSMPAQEFGRMPAQAGPPPGPPPQQAWMPQNRYR